MKKIKTFVRKAKNNLFSLYSPSIWVMDVDNLFSGKTIWKIIDVRVHGVQAPEVWLPKHCDNETAQIRKTENAVKITEQ